MGTARSSMVGVSLGTDAAPRSYCRTDDHGEATPRAISCDSCSSRGEGNYFADDLNRTQLWAYNDRAAERR